MIFMSEVDLLRRLVASLLQQMKHISLNIPNCQHFLGIAAVIYNLLDIEVGVHLRRGDKLPMMPGLIAAWVNKIFHCDLLVYQKVAAQIYTIHASQLKKQMFNDSRFVEEATSPESVVSFLLLGCRMGHIKDESYDS